MRFFTLPMIALSLVMAASPILAEESEEVRKPPEDLMFGKGEGGYMDFMWGELEKIGAMDLYGVTSQLPQGYFSYKWDWGTIKASKRYNAKRQLGPVMEPIEFTEGDEKMISIDMGLEGHGGGHTFQFSYGITDPLDWYIEIPFTYMNVGFKPKIREIDDEGNKISPKYAQILGIDDPSAYNAGQFNTETLPMLGRPSVATDYKAKWMLGDINTGFSWNIYRTPRFSVALTPRVYLPTGHIPPSNRNILYGTGPELETGLGGWAVGATQGYDVRLFKYSWWIDVIASSEFTAAYALPQEREYPTNFPDLRTPEEKEMGAPTKGEMVDAASFPNLSHLDGKFDYFPGWSMSWTAQLGVHFGPLGLGAGYGIEYSQEPELNGDPDFIQMAQSLELLGASSVEMVQLAVSLGLLPFIPAEVSFQWKKVVDGYNAIVFDDFYQLTVKGYIPLFVLWD